MKVKKNVSQRIWIYVVAGNGSRVVATHSFFFKPKMQIGSFGHIRWGGLFIYGGQDKKFKLHLGKSKSLPTLVFPKR